MSQLFLNQNFYLPKGEYILSGCAEGGATDKYYIQLYKSAASINAVDIGQGVKFVITDDEPINYVRIFIKKSQVFDNVTFYPMIKRESIDSRLNDVDSRLNSILEWKLYTTITSSTNVNINTLFNKSYSEVLLRYGSDSGTRGSAVLPRDIFEATMASTSTSNTVCMIPTAYNTNTQVAGYTSGNNKFIKHNYSDGNLYIYYR